MPGGNCPGAQTKRPKMNSKAALAAAASAPGRVPSAMTAASASAINPRIQASASAGKPSICPIKAERIIPAAVSGARQS